MSLGPLYVLLGEVSVQILSLFCNWVVCLRVESCEILIYFGAQTFVQGIICKYIFPYGWFPFHFTDVFFSCAEAFYFDEIPFVYSFLYIHCSRGHIGENIAALFSWRTFRVLWLIFKSFIHLEFIFVCGVSWWLSFIFLHVAVQIQHPLLKRLFLLPFYGSSPFVLYNWQFLPLNPFPFITHHPPILLPSGKHRYFLYIYYVCFCCIWGFLLIFFSF